MSIPRTHDSATTPFDPAFNLRVAAMGIQLALDALHQGDTAVAAGHARAVAESLGEAHAALTAPNLVVVR